jgi:hypothetical protein
MLEKRIVLPRRSLECRRQCTAGRSTGAGSEEVRERSERRADKGDECGGDEVGDREVGEKEGGEFGGVERGVECGIGALRRAVTRATRKAVSREAVSGEAVSREAVSGAAVSREAMSGEAVSRAAERVMSRRCRVQDTAGEAGRTLPPLQLPAHVHPHHERTEVAEERHEYGDVECGIAVSGRA